MSDITFLNNGDGKSGYGWYKYGITKIYRSCQQGRKEEIPILQYSAISPEHLVRIENGRITKSLDKIQRRQRNKLRFLRAKTLCHIRLLEHQINNAARKATALKVIKLSRKLERAKERYRELR